MIQTLSRVASALRRTLQPPRAAGVADPVAHFPDVAAEDRETYLRVQPFTMTSPERVLALCGAVRYVSTARLPGAFVECGVWKGGSAMAAALTLLRLGDATRDLYLFDTFEGMTAPSAEDVDHAGERASELLRRHTRTEEDAMWCYAPKDGVQRAMEGTGYPRERLHLVQGPVEQTLPGAAPEQIALLRLDTDWYESTRHELEVLFPRLVQGGVLIIDDYGHWRGARTAVDEYLAKHGVKLLLNRIDYTGRIAVKVWP